MIALSVEELATSIKIFFNSDVKKMNSVFGIRDEVPEPGSHQMRQTGIPELVRVMLENKTCKSMEEVIMEFMWPNAVVAMTQRGG